MLPTDKSRTRKRQEAIAATSGDRPQDEDSQLVLEVQALAELLLDMFEYKKERERAPIAGPEPPILDVVPERHTI